MARGRQLRPEAGGDPTLGPVPEMANDPRVGEAPDDTPLTEPPDDQGREGQRDQGKPDLDEFAERLGLADDESVDDEEQD